MADMPRFHLSSVKDSELTEFYVKNGFVLVEHLITAKEQEEIRTDLAKINRGYYDDSSIEPVDWSLDDQRLLAVICILVSHTCTVQLSANMSPILAFVGFWIWSLE